MGCQSIAPVIPQATKHTLFGVINIHLRHLHLEGQHGKSGKAASILVKMTNQSFKTKPILGEDVSESVDFTVNSRYQKHGRSLIVQAFKEGMMSQSSVGLGITDLQFIIREKKKEVLKVYLNHDSKRVGWVEIEANFVQVSAFPITLLFDSALIRRKTSKFTSVKCKIRTTIGQEVLQTKVCEDKEDQPPTWRNEQLTFFVLKDKTKEGKVQILDGEVQIGHISINLQQVSSSTETFIQLNEQFHFQEDIVAGTIKFAISKAENIQIKDSQPKKSVFITPSKKKLPPLSLPETAISKEKQSQADRIDEAPIQHAAVNPIIVKPKDKSIEDEERQKKEDEEKKLKEIAQLKAQQDAKLLKEQEEMRIKEEKQKLARQEQSRKMEVAKKLKQEQEKEKEAKLKEEKRLKQLEEEAKLKEQAEKERKREEQAKKAKEEEEKRKQQEEQKKAKEEQARLKQEEQARLKQEEQAKKLKDEQERKLKQEEAKKLKEKEEEQQRKKEREQQEEQKAKKVKEAEQQLKKKEQEQKLAREHEEEQKRKEEIKKIQEANRLKQQQQHAIMQQQEQKAKEQTQRKRQAEESHSRAKEAAVQTHEPKQVKVQEVKEVKEETPLPQHTQKPTEQTEQHP